MLERASGLRRAGRVEEAVDAYRQLLEREPDLPESWYNLAWLQKQARQFEPALHSYAQALSRGVRDPEEVHLNRAVILSDHLGRPDEARAELQAALDLQPGYVAALLNLGNLHEDCGDRAAAEAAYRRTLAVAPGHSLALSRLAGLVSGNSPQAQELRLELERALSASRPPAERADLGFALGRLLDTGDKFDDAFAAYEAANRASRETCGSAFRPYDRTSHERFIDRLIEAFPEPRQPLTGQGVSPIFILGMFRSGSTLVEQILAGHSRIAAGGELDLIPALVQRITGYPETVTAADEETLLGWREFHAAAVPKAGPATELLTDKRPDNFLHVGLIKTLFPDARIIHTRRNRLDNLLSLYFLHLDPAMAYALDLRDADHWYGQYERLMAHWKRLYPNDIFDLDYDALVREPEPVVRSLCEFLGLEWEERALDFHSRAAPVKTASVWQVRERLHARSSGRWQNYERQLQRALGSAPSR